jgi:UDPglucose--hexose-1-phosphate uridylyltransferase
LFFIVLFYFPSVPEYRQDPLTERIVIVAEERALRPHQFDIENSGLDDHSETFRKFCPFCEGNESLTPNEIMAFRHSDSLPDHSGWSVRVVPNKFPAVIQHVDFPREFEEYGWSSHDDCEFYHPENKLFRKSVPGFGRHEVIVDAPRHILSISEMTDHEVIDMFRMYQERLKSLRKEECWKYIQIFKNVGAAAGASIPHSHSQLLAMPFVPKTILSIWRNAANYSSNAKKIKTKQNLSDCVWCDRLKSEIQERKRIVEETPHFVALCPFVSRFSGEVEIYPKQHEADFENNVQISEFALLIRRTIIRLERASWKITQSLAYNLVLNTEPFDFRYPSFKNIFHWHFSILPSLARAAGFEWGTGLHINPISPEKTAVQLANINTNELNSFQ